MNIDRIKERNGLDEMQSWFNADDQRTLIFIRNLLLDQIQISLMETPFKDFLISI